MNFSNTAADFARHFLHSLKTTPGLATLLKGQAGPLPVRLTADQPVALSSARDQLIAGLGCLPVVCQISDSDGRKAALTRPRECFHDPLCDVRQSKPEDSLTFHLKY